MNKKIAHSVESKVVCKPMVDITGTTSMHSIEMLPSHAMEKIIFSICELEITSALCSNAFVVIVKWNMADPQILTCYCWKGQRLSHLGSLSIKIFCELSSGNYDVRVWVLGNGYGYSCFHSRPLLVFTIFSIAHECTITLKPISCMDVKLIRFLRQPVCLLALPGLSGGCVIYVVHLMFLSSSQVTFACFERSRSQMGRIFG